MSEEIQRHEAAEQGPETTESELATGHTLPAVGPLAEPVAPRPAAWRFVLFGPDGLRPGWGLLLFFVLLVSIGAMVNFTIRKVHPRPAKTAEQRRADAAAEQKPTSMLIGEGSAFALVALTTWIMGRIERRPVGRYGFGGARETGGFFAGFAWGLLFLAALVGTLWKTGLLVFDGRLLFGAAVWKYGAIWMAGFLLVGFTEEYLLRGYLQFTLARGMKSLTQLLFKTSHGETIGFWTAAAVLSFIFGFGHGNNPGESPIGMLSAGLIGLIFCLTLWKTGSLWWALGFHASWDWAQSFLFGVADSGTMVQGHLFATHPVGRVILSGGATGPEGSAFILPLLAIVTVVVFATLPGRAHKQADVVYMTAEQA
jgi:membrane protease YdiL (CAAX protease family)